MEGLKIDEIMAQIPDVAPGDTGAGTPPPNKQEPGALKPQFSYGDEFNKEYPKK